MSSVVFVRSRVFSERFLREVGVLDTTGSKKSFRERERERRERRRERTARKTDTDAERRRKTEKEDRE